jgi:G6PDH family F420-dependent oxidoreductase
MRGVIAAIRGSSRSVTTFGYFLSSEEHPPSSLVEQAVRAEQAGFEALWISDHYHPWNDAQGQSPFVWSVLGGIAARTERVRCYTAVTAPTVRIHPAVIAQAAATTQVMFDGRFGLGIGSGEALNEHIFGDAWPTADVRLEMLEEAVDVMRQLWTGDVVRHQGKHYTVDTARIYTLPPQGVPVLVSGFGEKATELAAKIGDGYVTTSPDKELVDLYRKNGGKGPAQAGVKVCWAADKAAARKTVHRLWANSALPGEAAQVLPSPQHFEQLSELVTEDQAVEGKPCGPDVTDFVEAVKKYIDAGIDEIYLSQMGHDQDGFFRFWESELKDALADL